MLEIKNLSKSYGTVHALSDVSFSADRGKVTALLGENGAGKSTLVRVLSGLVQPSGGEIRLDGSAVDLSSPDRALRSGVAVVQQEISVLSNLTVAENFLLASPSAILSRRRAAEWCKPYLERLGLGHVRPETLVSELTIGERQLIEIARMLAQDAKLLVLDEPTAALADHDIDLVHEAVRRLVSDNKIILYITHRLNELDEICDDVVVLRNGELADAFKQSDATINRVVHAMIGRELEELYPERPGRVVPAEPIVRLEDVRTPDLAATFSLELQPGEIVATCGQLGSGLVEPLRAIFGIAEPQQGEITFGGGHSGGAPTEEGIAYCSEDRQHDGFFNNRAVWESLSAPKLAASGLWGFVNPQAMRRSVAPVADRMTILPAYRERAVSALSGGNAQKVSIGKWLSNNPKILLLEEPTRGVDVGARAEIYALLRELAREGMAVLFASSDLDEVLGFGDRVLIFHANRMVHEAPTRDLSRDTLATWITHGGL
ncbi:MAG: ABC transporter ATP-binding protein [Rhizobiales bacterium]|nr:ABC transporter ATP-binding protein [Hyphomicrobiales bacterium]MBA68386.1 ABC transporter ATP-binding protein [Hyphomicrobiales bacterium]|tara:strand:+ start:29 stop:1495 length:1467 start_codon:yes stop_codon:yes gene_type:complete